MKIIWEVGYAQAILDLSADLLQWNATVLQKLTSTGKLHLQTLQHAITWVCEKTKNAHSLRKL